MRRKDIIVNVSNTETRIAVLQDGSLIELYLERSEQTSLVGHIYKAKVLNVISGLKAAFVNLLGPGPYLGWSLVMGPLLLEGWRKAPINGIVLVAGFYSTMVISLAVLIYIFASARKLGPKVTRITATISIVGLVCFAFYELWLGISYLIIKVC